MYADSKDNSNIHQAGIVLPFLGYVWEQVDVEKSFDIGGFMAYCGLYFHQKEELCVAVPCGVRLSVKCKNKSKTCIYNKQMIHFISMFFLISEHIQS